MNDRCKERSSAAKWEVVYWTSHVRIYNKEVHPWETGVLKI